MKPLDKVLAVRRNAKLKSLVPMRTFHARLKQPRVILDLVEKKGTSAARFEARRLYLVALCAAFELFWRDLLSRSVTRSRHSVQRNAQLGRVNFNIGDVQQIIERKIKIGELMACAYSFQGPDPVNQAVSEIFGVQAFTKFRSTKYELREVPRKNRSKKLGPPSTSYITGEFALKKTHLISKCFAIRHDTVHDIGVRHRISRSRCFEMDQAIWVFNMLFGMFVQSLPDNLKADITV